MNAQISPSSSLQYTPKLSRALPDSLMVLPQFVCHRAKVPYDPNTGKKADTTNPETWGTFTEARRAYERGRYDGIGFVFAEDAGITGVDLDACRDKETGQLEEWAAQLVARFAPCYAEISPSGTGVHLLMLGMLPDGRRRKGRIEMYDGARFFTLTGDTLTGSVSALEPRQDALEALYGELFPAKTEQPVRSSGEGITLSDRELLDKASKADPAFAALMRGDISAYDHDESRGDYAYASKLAWWSDSDEAQMERCMRASGLAREKWEKRDGQYGTYLARTIQKAIEDNAGRCYSGAKADIGTCKLDTCKIEAPAQETSMSAPQNDCCAAKDKIIARLQRELAKERENRQQIERELAWERKLRANKQLSPAQKIVGSVLRDQWKKAAAKGAQEEMPIHLPTMAKQTGLSERTVSTTIQQFHSMGAAKREEKHPVAETGPNKGKRVTRIYVDPRPLLEQPDKTMPEKPRNHGGKRVCPDCGSKHLRVRIHAQVTCMECGNKWETESAERILRGDESEMTARSDAMLASGPFEGCQDDTSETTSIADENCRLKESVQIRDGKRRGAEEPVKPCSVTGDAHIYGYMRRADGTPLCVECDEPLPAQWQSFYHAAAVG